MVQWGMGFFVLATLCKWLLHFKSPSGQSVADFVTGILYGLSIGCMILGLIKSKRRPDAAAPPNQL
jgi:hypothetical protein